MTEAAGANFEYQRIRQPRQYLPPRSGLVAGSIFVESVFAWPGMGRLMVNAIVARDYPLVMGAAAVYATLVLIANLAGDLALPLVDPRRRA